MFFSTSAHFLVTTVLHPWYCLLGMVLYPLAQSQTVRRRADRGEALSRISQPLPQVLQSLPEAVNSEDVNDADEIAFLWPIYYVNGVFEVRQ